MSEQTVTLKFTTAGGKEVTAVVRGVTVAIDDMGEKGKRAAEKIDAGMDKAEKSLDDVEAAAKKAGSSMKKVGEEGEKAARRTHSNIGKTRAGLISISKQLDFTKKQAYATFAYIFSASTVRSLKNMADSWKGIGAQLNLATKGTVNQVQAMEAVYGVSQRTSAAMAETATLTGKLTSSLAEMGMKGDVAFSKSLGLAETINQTFAISGASAEAQKNAMIQFSQALDGGVLRAQEFNSVLQAAPRMVSAIATGMGKTMGEFRQAVNDGKVTSADMIAALEAQAGTIKKEAESLPLTISNAWTQMENAILRYVGQTDAAYGISVKVAGAIKWMAENIEHVVSMFKTLGKMAFAVYTTKLLLPGLRYLALLNLKQISLKGLIVTVRAWGVAAWQANLKAGASLKGVGLAYGAMAALFVGWSIGDYLHDNFAWARQGGVALMAGLMKAWSYIKQGAITAWEAIKMHWLAMVGTMRNALAGFFSMFANAAKALPDFIGGTALSGTLEDWASKLRADVVPTLGDIASAVGRIHDEFSKQRALDDELWFEVFEEAAKPVQAAADGIADGSDAAATAMAGLGDAAKGAGSKAKAAKDKLQELLQAQAEFAAGNRRMEAQLAGPVAEAWYEYETGVAEARKALKELKATQEEVQIREQLLAETRDRTLAEIAKEQDVLGKLRAEYEEHLLLAGLSNRERRVEETLLRVINDAREKGKVLTAEEIQQTREWLRQQEYALEYAETQVRVAEDVEKAWTDTWSNAADAMGDWFARGLHDGKSFFKSLLQMAQRWVAQLAGMMMKSRLGEMFGRDFGAGTRRLSLADLIKPASNGQQSLSDWRSMLGGGIATGGIVQKLAGLFGLSRSGGFASAGWSFGSKQMSGGGGYFGTLTAAGIPAIPASAGSGHFGTLGMLGYNNASAFAKFIPWAGALLGGLYGLRAGGDAPGKLLGAGAYGALGYGGVAAGSALMAGGGLSGALSAFGPIGWAGLAAVALDKISGGKLFGTKYRVDSSALQIEFGDGGIGGHASSTEVKQRGLFRGRKWRTTTHALDDETRKNAERFLTELRKSLGKAAAQLGVDTPTLMAAQFRREFDKNGNLTREFGTIAGRVYNEAQEAFTQRLQAENLLNVAKAAGNAAEIERLADRYRATPEGLAEYAELLMAVQSDVKAAKQLWTDTGEGSLTRVVEAMERLSRGAETLTETYQRVMETTGQYGELMAGIEKELRTSGLNQWQKAVLDVEIQYRQQVQQANVLAKALGLSRARSEDLAKIELLRAKRMAELQRQIEQQRDAALAGLSLSEYSPLTDQQKLAEAMQQFDAAIAAGDINSANNLAQTVLGLGRNLYASGNDYNALYGRVTDAIRNIAMPALDMDDGTTIGDLAQILLDLPNQFAHALYAAAAGELPVTAAPPVAGVTPAPLPASIPAPAPVPPSGGGGGHKGSSAFDSVQMHGGFDIGRPDNGGYQRYLKPDIWERIEEHLAALRSDSHANRRDNTAERLHELVMNK